jgi:predicted Zn-dependent peptidase
LFFNKVREELGLVYNIGSSVSINPDYGSFIISAQTSNPTLALETINEVYREFVASTIDDTTLENSKNHVEGTHLLSSVKNSSKLSMLSSIANKSLELDFFDTYVDKINSVTSEDIKESFKAIQHNQSLTVMVGDI